MQHVTITWPQFQHFHCKLLHVSGIYVLNRLNIRLYITAAAVVVIIIIIGKSIFEPYPFSEDSAKFDPIFTSLLFATIFIAEQGRRPCI
jgi:hypothetical protein